MVSITAYFPATIPLQPICASLAQVLPAPRPGEEMTVTAVPLQDWNTAWRRFYKPVWATERMVIQPPWIPVAVRPPQFAILIDPKMAFGTGGHESTRLCLRALEEWLTPGDSCLDLGVGSGILSLAALNLGAERVLGLDVDPQAIDNARENLALNGLDDNRVTVRVGALDSSVPGFFDLIMANIESGVLQPLLPQMARQARRVVLLSGLLNRERDGFTRQVQAAGMVVQQVYREGEWICIAAAAQGGRCPVSG